jgi:UDP-N-acetylmuramyl pentapeptide synthase
LNFQLLLTVGARAEKIAAGAREAGFPAARIKSFDQAESAGNYLRTALPAEAVALFKGSRGMALEKAIAEFGHE